MAKIGIRLADGRFYPILDDDATARKRLVVTTVKDDQPSVQIDVYRSADEGDAYVGSLVIENIPPRPSGEPDIRLDLALDDEGKLSAFAQEEATGEHQALTVSLRSLAEEEKYEIPDFDFQEDEDLALSTDAFPETEETTGADFSFDESTADTRGEPAADIDFAEPAEAPGRQAREEPEEARRRVSPGLVGILAAIATALILVAAFFIYRCTADRPAEPPTAVATREPAKAAEAPKAPEPAKVAEAPKAPEPAKTPAKTGTWHKVKGGDTLWDISIAYYRTPWLYKTIAKANNIRNPDLIISGTRIYIPPR